MAQLGAIVSRVGTRRVAIGIAAVLIAGGGAGSFLAVQAATSGSAPAGQLTAATTAPGSPATGSPTTHGKGWRHPLLAALVRATAKETGLSAKTIREDLQSGQTIDQIAGSKASAVENDVLSALQGRLDKARAKGRITQQQETNRLNKARTRIEKLMTTPLKTHAAAGAASATAA